MYRRQNAFTLIELLVVISIIALLVGILLPALGRARLAAQNIAGLSNDRQIATSIYTYATNNNGYSPTTLGQRWDATDPSNASFDAFEAEDEMDSSLRGGGWTLWSGDNASISDPDNENPASALEELGLGHLVSRDLITAEFFFHPVMQEVDAGGGTVQDGWFYTPNVGDSTTTDSAASGLVSAATGVTATTGDAPSGNTWADVSYTVRTTFAYRNGDRTSYEAGGLTAGNGRVNFSLSNNLIESQKFAGSVIATDTPLDNQANRMGGVLGYVLGDGSAGHHTTPSMLGGQKDGVSNNGIVALGAPDDGEGSAATFAGPYAGVTGGWDGGNALANDIQTAGWWCYLVDVELGNE